MAISTINSSGLNQAGDTVFCTTSGNVGIGTSSPLTKFTVSGGYISQTDGTVRTYLGADGSGGALVGTTTNQYLRFITNDTERARIDSSGNVGIGTSSPAGKLEVYGLTGSPSNGFIVGFGANGDNYYTSGSSGIHVFRNAGTERARIDSSGNFLFNCTGYTGDTTNVDGSAALGGGNFKFRKGASGWQWLQFYGTNTASGIGAIQNSSNTGVQYLTTSDYRLKTEVQPMVGALEKVAQLKPCTYTWVSTQEQGQGFIAHELQEVVPDAVAGEKDAVNEDGSIKPQSIDTSFLVATLTAAIQELKAIVDAQGAEIAALKGTA